MFDYLEKFNNLPQELRDKISTPKILAVINELEENYGVSLATVVMKIMTKDLDINNLVSFLRKEFEMEASKANLLATDLKGKVFKDVRDYLGFVLPQAGTKNDIKNQKGYHKKNKKNDFFFSPEDEKDIKSEINKISDFGDLKKAGSDIDRQAEEIAKKFQIDFSSEELENRFVKIVRTYVRSVRDKIEAKHALMKSVSEGGVGLDENEAGQVIASATKLKFNINTHNVRPPAKIKLSAEDLSENEQKKQNNNLKNSAVRDVDYDFSSLSGKKLDTEHELAPPPPAIRKEEDIKREKEDESLIKKKIKNTLSKKQEEKNKQVDAQDKKKKDERVLDTPEKKIQPRSASQENNKNKISDVKHAPLIMGPIDELRYMNLDSFRRLGSKNKIPKKKIKEIIDLLAKDGIDKKIAGIEAWRKSPVNKMYLEVGKESISQQSPINVIIEDKVNKGEKVLTSQEFKEIMAINRSLNF